MARVRCAVVAACSWLRSCSYVATESDSSGWETAAGTAVPEHCVGCTVDDLFLRIAAIPFCQSQTRTLLIFQYIRPGMSISTKLEVHGCRGTYLTLVFVRVDELCSVAGNFGLARSRVLLGTVQGDLDVLDIRIEDRVEVPR